MLDALSHAVLHIGIDKGQPVIVQAPANKDKGYFLYKALKKRGIIGPFAGATKAWKLNTYGLSWDQIKYLSDSFKEIGKENGLKVK